jgi:hypothetical protein
VTPVLYRKVKLDDYDRPIFDEQNNPVPEVGLPHEKQREIMQYIFSQFGERSTILVDLCCGIGYGKTTLEIDIAQAMLSLGSEQRGLFLEPDISSVNDIFLVEWEKIVPEELYKINHSQRRIYWLPTGAILYYGPRVVTGSRSYAADKYRGRNLTFVIDDETAIGFLPELYTNLLGRIRVKSPYRLYFTASTPKVGPYGLFIQRSGNKLFRGATWDNPFMDRETIDGLKANMSADQARRELGGELVALEGRIWRTADVNTAWPNGNRHDQWTSFRKGEPWWLFCDLGGATGSYVVVQQATGYHKGRKLFDGPVWVAVADLCPDSDASASRAFQVLKQEFGTPAGITAGADVNTRASTDGRTIAYFAQQIWANVRIYPCNESKFSKQIQYDRMNYLICSANGERRFTVARDYKSFDPDSHRGVIEMLEQDAWPDKDKRRPTDVLPKNKEIVVQHVRDALLMGAAMIMSPPDWRYNANPAR